jgi:hypothetical protein
MVFPRSLSKPFRVARLLERPTDLRPAWGFLIEARARRTGSWPTQNPWSASMPLVISSTLRGSQSGVEEKNGDGLEKQAARPSKFSQRCGGKRSGVGGILPWGLAIVADQVGLVGFGLTPSVDGNTSVSRRCITEPLPRPCKLNNVALDASRISPTVLKSPAFSALRIRVEKCTFSTRVSSGSSGAG